jgi:hypothetical protein
MELEAEHTSRMTAWAINKPTFLNQIVYAEFI